MDHCLLFGFIYFLVVSSGLLAIALNTHHEIPILEHRPCSGERLPMSLCPNTAFYIHELISDNLQLCKINGDFSHGLEAATAAIWNSEKQICDVGILAGIICSQISRASSGGLFENIERTVLGMSRFQINKALYGVGQTCCE